MILAATGHRPPALLGYSDEAFATYVTVARGAIREHDPEVVISGMAQGWDMAIAEAALELDTPLHAYVAFPGVDRKWYPRDRRRFKRLCEAAAKIVVVSEGKFTNWKMQARNEAMVDACDAMAACWNGKQHGGTWNCLKYASERGVPWKNYFEDVMFEV